MKYTKMQGAGNDFIIINNIEENIPVENLPDIARRLCSRRLSIGADGLMAVVKAERGGDYGMLFYNSDGSVGEMCGNGARCICRYGHDRGLAAELQRVETISGTVVGERLSQRLYRVRLNSPTLAEAHRSVSLEGHEYDCAYIELGSPGLPHAVLLIDRTQREDMDSLRELGRKLRHAKEFPKGANVNFVSLVDDNLVDIITFERGVEDFTLACGTGCGSAALALYLRGMGGRRLRLRAPGAELSVELGEGDIPEDVYLSGPTCYVSQGDVLDEELDC